jgi:hypothetical protein
MRRLLALLAVSLGAGALAAPANGAAPRYIMITGRGIPKPILLADWRENMAFELAIANAPKAARPPGLSVRPRVELWLFWGWGERRPKRPEQANQHGWLYLAVGSQPALVVLKVDGTSKPRLVSAPLRRILERHDVPTRRRLLSSSARGLPRGV